YARKVSKTRCPALTPYVLPDLCRLDFHCKPGNSPSEQIQLVPYSLLHSNPGITCPRRKVILATSISQSYQDMYKVSDRPKFCLLYNLLSRSDDGKDGHTSC